MVRMRQTNWRRFRCSHSTSGTFRYQKRYPHCFINYYSTPGPDESVINNIAIRYLLNNSWATISSASEQTGSSIRDNYATHSICMRSSWITSLDIIHRLSKNFNEGRNFKKLYCLCLDSLKKLTPSDHCK